MSVAALSQEAMEYAEEHLGETDKARREALIEIRRWIGENPKINACPDEEAILPFLRTCKFDLEKTKCKLKRHYEIRARAPQWFSNRDPKQPKVRELLKLGVFLPLRRSMENRLVIVVRMRAYDPSRYPFDEVMKVGKMVLDVACRERQEVQVYGVAVVFDLTDMTFAHVKPMTLDVVRNFADLFQNDHCRPKQMEILHAPFYVYVIVRLLKSFLSYKLQSRIAMNRDVKSLYKNVDRKILPPEYGGDGESVQDLIDYWGKKIQDHSEWLRENEKYKADLT